jgi:hypothetical protein
MVKQLTLFGISADDPYAEVGEQGQADEEREGSHWG